MFTNHELLTRIEDAWRVAPTCEHCDCRIIGHGVESGGALYCCVSCARQTGVGGLRDRSETGPMAH